MPARKLSAELRGAAPVFAALGDETRLMLVARLCEDAPLSITELAEGTPVTRQAITKHLHVLAGAGVLYGRRRGRERVWEVDSRQLRRARRCLKLIASRQQT